MARAWMKAALAGMAIMAMTAPVHAADTIKIGVPGAHSGDLVSYGMPSLNAARIVADEYNAKGGILGKQIEIIAEDDQCKPELGTNAATKVLSEGAVAVMGSICSGATKAALPIYNDAKIVSISPSATTPELTQKGDHPYFFRTIASDDVSGHLAGSFAKDKLGLKKVALLHDKGDYGRGFVNYAREMLEKGGVQIVLEEGITPGAVDYGEGDTIAVGGLTVEVLSTPGHSEGGVTLRCGDVLFCGDTLFAGSCGRTDFVGGSMTTLMDSLARLGRLTGNYRVLPGHMEPSDLDTERRMNPYLIQAMRK